MILTLIIPLFFAGIVTLTILIDYLTDFTN